MTRYGREMTDRDLKKLTETTQLPRKETVFVSSLHARGAKSAAKTGAKASAPAPVDTFEDDGLDELLGNALDEASEPRLLLVDKLLTRTRVRREV